MNPSLVFECTFFRLMKKVPELMIIIKGMVASFRSVGCTAILQGENEGVQ